MQTALLYNPQHIQSRVNTLLAIAEKQGYDIQLVGGCAEPGYTDGPIALGNWNERERYSKNEHVFITTDDTMPRLAKLFEKLGYEIEREDEWAMCDNCGKAIRTQLDSYSWKPYYRLLEHARFICGNCVKESPTDYLSAISGNPNKCECFGLDLSEYGYTLYSERHENGLHPGQNADPKAIAKHLWAEGITDFIFVLDSQGQFDCEFSIWVRTTSQVR